MCTAEAGARAQKVDEVVPDPALRGTCRTAARVSKQGRLSSGFNKIKAWVCPALIYGRALVALIRKINY